MLGAKLPEAEPTQRAAHWAEWAGGQMEGPCCSQHEEQDAVQAAFFFPQDSLREAARACLAARGAGAGLCKAKAMCCINRRPVPGSCLTQSLSAGTPGTVTSIPSWSCLLRAQPQPHNAHTVPSPLAQPPPWGCSSLFQPLWCTIPKAVHGAGEHLEAEGEQREPSELAQAPGAPSFISPQL